MRTLKGASIALLEARMSHELSTLVRRYGGEPRSAPALREAPLDAPDAVAAFVERLCRGEFALAVFLTGVGVTTLLKEADRLGRLASALDTLRAMQIACRGSKPVTAMRQHGVPVQITARAPFTSAELLDALDVIDLDGLPTALVHYGERSDGVARALRERGAALEELCLYEWLLPEDVEPMRALIDDIVGGRVDAVVFTSKVQCRHLFQVAARKGQTAELAAALNRNTTVAVIGPVCRTALREHGVVSHVMPATPKMAPLVAAIAEYFELTSAEL